MKKISIGEAERDLASATSEWIRDQVQALRSRGLPVCVRVHVKSGPINIAFSTPACGGERSTDRQPTIDEQRILDLWRKRGLNDEEFAVSQLVAFLADIKRV